MSTPGVEIHLMPDWIIHPVVAFDYVWVEGGSFTDDGAKVTFGAEIILK
jgi:hypothetical protein